MPSLTFIPVILSWGTVYPWGWNNMFTIPRNIPVFFLFSETLEFFYGGKVNISRPKPKILITFGYFSISLVSSHAIQFWPMRCRYRMLMSRGLFYFPIKDDRHGWLGPWPFPLSSSFEINKCSGHAKATLYPWGDSHGGKSQSVKNIEQKYSRNFDFLV